MLDDPQKRLTADSKEVSGMSHIETCTAQSFDHDFSSHGFLDLTKIVTLYHYGCYLFFFKDGAADGIEKHVRVKRFEDNIEGAFPEKIIITRSEVSGTDDYGNVWILGSNHMEKVLSVEVRHVVIHQTAPDRNRFEHPKSRSRGIAYKHTVSVIVEQKADRFEVRFVVIHDKDRLVYHSVHWQLLADRMSGNPYKNYSTRSSCLTDERHMDIVMALRGIDHMDMNLIIAAPELNGDGDSGCKNLFLGGMS